MPPRRTHRKSRGGCLRCKARRIKCDEIHPKCGPCTKRELPCSFEDGGSFDSSPSTPFMKTSFSAGASPADSSSAILGPTKRSQEIPRDEISPGMQNIDLNGDLQATRIQELRLLHHYSTITYESFSEKERDNYFNKVAIPRLAMNHDFLLDSLFAVAALHLEQLKDKPGRYWLRAGLDYQQRSLVNFSKAVRNINAQNCEAVTVCSMFTIVAALAAPAVTGDHPVDSMAGMLGLRGLLEGVVNILHEWRGYLLNGELKDFFEPMLDPPFWNAEIMTRMVEENQSMEVSNVTSSILSNLQKLDKVFINTTSPHRDIYRTACKILQNMVHTFINNKSAGSMMSFPLLIDPHLVSLSESGDILARVIFLHYGVVLHLNHEKWYISDGGKRLVQAMAPLLEGELEWSDVLKWAKMVVGAG